MAILDKFYKVEPYITSAAGKIKLLISSKFIQMENGSTLEDKMSTVDSNVSKVSNKFVGISAITAGTKVVSIARDNTSVQVFTTSEIDELLGISGSNNANTSLSFANGDGKAQRVHVEGATYQDGKWYAVMDAGAVVGSIRINYIIAYFGSSTPSSSTSAKTQEKTVYSSTSEQVITPDTGYDALSKVTVKAIPYTETTDSSGGTTVDIG